MENKRRVKRSSACGSKKGLREGLGRLAFDIASLQNIRSPQDQIEALEDVYQSMLKRLDRPKKNSRHSAHSKPSPGVIT
jgi:hypothetical protein